MNVLKYKTYNRLLACLFSSVVPTEASPLLLSLSGSCHVSLSEGFQILQIPMKFGGKISLGAKEQLIRSGWSFRFWISFR